MELVLLAVFVAYIFGYIYANSEGIDMYLQYYSLDSALTINSMMAGDNEVSTFYSVDNGYNLDIDQEKNKICASYIKNAEGLKSVLASIYRKTKGKLNERCELFVPNGNFRIIFEKKDLDSYMIKKVRA